MHKSLIASMLVGGLITGAVQIKDVFWEKLRQLISSLNYNHLHY